MRPALLLSAASLLAVAACSRGKIEDPIQLDSGLVAGGVAADTGVRYYKGLPFGAPPVGDLRWREPQPVAPWEGVRDATQYGNVCIQPPGQGRLNIAAMDGSPPLSEDCLYLNVWTSAQTVTDKLPVMVYFFGGAFTEGGGSVPLYDGTELAKKGAVVVTMNYRLGAFGFFTHPALTADSSHEFSGNYGILDMLASLEWVQRNIAAFGGDPGNVTIFGQSAGAMAIGSLIASPRATGLFHRAIGQSVMGGGVAPAERLDHGRGVHSGRGPEGIGPHHRVIDRDRHLAGARHELAVLTEPRQVVVDVAHQPQVDQQEVHGRVADPLADPERRAVHAVDTREDRLEGIGEVEAAVRGTASARGLKAGALIHATRVAVTGRTQSPGLFEVLAWLGRDRVGSRLARLLEFLSTRV